MTANLFLSQIPSTQTPFLGENEKDYVKTLLQEDCVADIEHWGRCYASLPTGSGLREQIKDRLSVYHVLRRLIVAYLHRGLTDNECSVSMSGSNKPTSDLDVSVMGPNVETFFWRLQKFLEEQGMSLAGFCKRFDVNFYAAPCINLRGTALISGVCNDLVHLPVLFSGSKETSHLTIMVSTDGTEGLPLPMTSEAIDVDWTLCLRQLLPYSPPTTNDDWELRLEQASQLHRQWTKIMSHIGERGTTSTTPVIVEDTEHAFWDLLSQVMRMSPEAYYSCSATTLVLCILQNRGPYLTTRLQSSSEIYAHVIFMAVVENAIIAKRHERETRLFEKYHARVLHFARLFPVTSFRDNASLSHLVSRALTFVPLSLQTIFEPMTTAFVLTYLTEETIDQQALMRYMHQKISATTRFVHSKKSPLNSWTSPQTGSFPLLDHQETYETPTSISIADTQEQRLVNIEAPTKPSTGPRPQRSYLRPIVPRSQTQPITATPRTSELHSPSVPPNRRVPLPLQPRGSTGS